MRGEHHFNFDVGVVDVGIIPACAGSTIIPELWKLAGTGSSPHARGARQRRLSVGPSRRDHPRMRGEHHFYARFGGQQVGIIPACAGSTKLDDFCDTSRKGSSPHARGALTERNSRVERA